MSQTNNATTPAKFRLLNFVVRESHFVLKEQGEHKIAINFDPKGYIFKSLNQFHLEMGVEVKEETDKFNIFLNTVGVFEFETAEGFEQFRDDYFVKNAPAIIFPYIRAYISTLTTQSGLFTIQLPTLNLSQLADRLKSNITELE